MWEPLLDRTAALGFTIKEVLGDAAYWARHTAVAAEKHGARPFIDYREGWRGDGPPAYERMYAAFMFRRPEHEEVYRFRVKSETGHSMIKTKYGGEVASRPRKNAPEEVYSTTRVNEILLKYLLHNVAVGVRAIHTLGFDGDFWPENGNEFLSALLDLHMMFTVLYRKQGDGRTETTTAETISNAIAFVALVVSVVALRKCLARTGSNKFRGQHAGAALTAVEVEVHKNVEAAKRRVAEVANDNAAILSRAKATLTADEQKQRMLIDGIVDQAVEGYLTALDGACNLYLQKKIGKESGSRASTSQRSGRPSKRGSSHGLQRGGPAPQGTDGGLQEAGGVKFTPR